MLLAKILPALLIPGLASGQADITSIRSQEAALASALRTSNKASLIRLTDTKRGNLWKLAVRIYRPVACHDGPQLAFPPN